MATRDYDWERRTVSIARVQLNGGTNTREIDPDKAREYGEAYERGDPMPRPCLFDDGKVLWVGDGHQRIQGRVLAGRQMVDADVTPGTQWDAILFAASANATHGVPRTKGEIAISVRRILSNPEYADWSDHRIAEWCACSHTHVANVRATSADPLATVASRARKGRDGRTYKKPKAAAEDYGDAAEGPILCKRCKNIGKETPDGGCKDCQSLRKKSSKKGPRASGKVLFDWKKYETHFGPVVRSVDDIARAYPEEKKGPEFKRAGELLDEFAKLMKAWQKRLSKVKG